jgi:hypothetical protein
MELLRELGIGGVCVRAFAGRNGLRFLWRLLERGARMKLCCEMYAYVKKKNVNVCV